MINELKKKKLSFFLVDTRVAIFDDKAVAPTPSPQDFELGSLTAQKFCL